MDILRTLFWLVGLVALALAAGFGAASIREGERRATCVSLTTCFLILALWLGGDAVLTYPRTLHLMAVAAAGLLAILFFGPWGRCRPIEIGEITERVDERDVIFAREEYAPGTERHEVYYARRPEKAAVDEMLRSLPPILEPGGRYYEPEAAERTQSLFTEIEAMLTRVDGPVAPEEMPCDTEAIKSLALHLGADEVGIASLHPMFVYSHVGRGPETWGASIENRHRFAIVMAFEMDLTCVAQAPHLPITEESATQYRRGARVSIALAEKIRARGYPARAHIAGSNYQVMLPPLGHAAGLGELGRMGYLISPRFGARMRLGAVTTDLRLIPDRPIAFGVQDFCRRCLKCAANCPSGAIPREEKTLVRGVRKWPLDIEQCLRYWRTVGTDCGLCMRVCPYSHPSTWTHNLIRAGLRRSAFARAVSIWGDDLLYGRRV